MTTETDLSSVNSILGAIGQAPISRMYHKVNGELEYINPEISFVHNILKEVDTDVQNEGWVFNREENYPLLPDADGYIYIPDKVLRMDVSEGQVYRTHDVVRRDGKLYCKTHHTFKFDIKQLNFDITWKFPFEDLPSVFQRLEGVQ